MSFNPTITRQGADGYLAFFTGTSALAGDNDLFFDRVNSRLGVNTSAPQTATHIVGPDGPPTSFGPFGQPLFIENNGDTVLTMASSDTGQVRLVFTGGNANSAEIYLDNSSDELIMYGPQGGVALYSSATGIGINNSPVTTLSADGVFALSEQSSSPSQISGWGLIYAKNDNKLYFKNDLGTEYDLTSAGGGVTAAQGSDGYIAFFTGSNSIAGDNDLYWERASNRLGIAYNLAPDAKLTIGSANDAFVNFYDLDSSIQRFTMDFFARCSWVINSGVAEIGSVAIGSPSGSPGFTFKDAAATQRSDFRLAPSGNGGFAWSAHALGSIPPELMRLDGLSGNLGLGTTQPHEKLTVNGVIAMLELDAFTRIQDGYGYIYTKSDNTLHFKNGPGVDQIVLTSALAFNAAGADGYLAFYTDTATLAGDNDLFYNRVTSDLSLVSGRMSIGSNTFPGSTYKLHIIDNLDSSVISSVQNTNTGANAFTQFSLFSDAGSFWFYKFGSGYTASVIDGLTRANLSEINSNEKLALSTNSVNSGIYFFPNASNVLTILASNSVGINTLTPMEALTVNGVVALQEQTGAPATQDGYGKIYVNNDDTLHYKNGPGVDQIVLTSALAFNPAGADGYLAFYTNTTTVAGDNDLFWDRTNNILGIGTSSPSTAASPIATLTIASPNANTRINIVAGETQGTNTIGFYGLGTPAFAGITGSHTNKGDGGSGHLSFQTDDGISHVTRMRILDTGDVGIGTEDPHEKLTLNGILSLQEQDAFNRTHDGYGSLWAKADGTIHFTNDAGTDYNLTAAAGLSATQGADGYLAFFTSGNTLAGDNDLFYDRVNNRLGIGTSAPYSIFHVAGDEFGTGTAEISLQSLHPVSGYTDIAFYDVGANYVGDIGLDHTGGQYYIDNYLDNIGYIVLATKTAGVAYNRLYIKNDGKIGMGTEAPAVNLHISSAESQTTVQIQTESTSATYASSLQYVDPSDNVSAEIYSYMGDEGYDLALVQYTDNIGTISLYTISNADYNVIRISASGDLGLGTYSPHEKLTVNGIISLQEQDVFNRTHDGYGSLWVKSDGTIHFTNDSGTDYNLTAAGGVSASQGADGYVAFFTGGNTIAGDNDFFFDRSNNRLTLGGGGTYVGSNGTATNPTYATGSGNTGTFEDDGGSLAFSIAGTQYFQMTSFGILTTTAGGLISIAQGNTVNVAYSSNAGTNTGIFFPSGPQVAIAIAGTEVMRATTDRRIAIGTTTADAMLHVAGDGYFDGYLMPRTDNMWGLGTPALRWRELYVGPGSLHVVSKSTDGGRPNRTFTWNVNEAGALELTADSTIVASFDKSAGASFPQGGGGGLSATQGADGYIAFFTGANSVAGDNDLFYDRVNGRLGVGTSTPSTPLHVRGTNASADIGIDAGGEIASIRFRDETNTGQGGIFYEDTGNYLGVARSISAAALNGLFVNSTGDIGINVTTPQARLEVEDNAMATGMVVKVTQDDHNVYGIVIGNDTFSTTDTDGMAMYVDNSGVSVIDARGTASRFSLQIGGTEAIRILNNRNIGLGTSAPVNKLDVEGAMAVGAGYSGTSTAPTNGMIIEGFVGIGTSSPSTANTVVDVTQSSSSTVISGVEIANDSTGDAFIRFNLGNARSYSMGIDNSDADKFIIGTAANGTSGVDTGTIMVITTAGDVGVGGTPVNSRLEVNSAANVAIGATAYNSVSGTDARGFLQARANGGGVIIGMNNTAHNAYTRGGEAMNGAAELVTFNAGDAVTKLIIGNVNASPIHFVVGDAKAATISANRDLGIGTQYPIERLTVNGAVALEEQGSTPATQDGYGKLYTNSTGDLSYVDDGGANIQITHADGYVNWTPSWINVIVKDADTGGDANEHTFPVDANWTGGAVDTTITGRGIYFNSVNGQFNITKAGVYRFFAQIPWSDSDTNTGNITFRVKKNDGTAMWLFDERWNNSTDVSPKTTVIDFIVEVPAGETLEMTWNPRNTGALINPLGSWFTIGIQQISM